MTTNSEIQPAQGALDVLDRHFVALNARDPEALAATLHFPHYRLGRGAMKVWATPETYLDDFFARAQPNWDHSLLIFRRALAASPDKVHFDIGFERYDQNAVVIGTYRSLWVVTKRDGKWAAALRSSFAE
ncbi:MAG: hypothetical protein ACR2PG_19860 [Hyphomicrobiaceae bacterium]